ncbi:Mn2+/Fe2+ transporter [Natrinema altunense]|uniref:Mn2+/Fe2+ transporter n=1 Tax=Natrinema altunense TaxID=222984 RepID=A0A482Y591_9EURY|nr:Mn2+/Fe2+ transporter [Natrinema altunense]RZH67987.1 Mn2+/Fe2+ transporter [Natrinema altunense]
MGDERDPTRSNPPVKNVLIVTIIILIATAIGAWRAAEVTYSQGTIATWAWIGIGLAAVYLLHDIATSVKELRDKL